MKVKLRPPPTYQAQVEYRLVELEKAAHLAQSAMRSSRTIRVRDAEFIVTVLRMAGMDVIEHPMDGMTELCMMLKST